MLSVTFLLLKLLNKNVTCEFYVRTVAVPSKFKDHDEDNILSSVVHIIHPGGCRKHEKLYPHFRRSISLCMSSKTSPNNCSFSPGIGRIETKDSSLTVDCNTITRPGGMCHPNSVLVGTGVWPGSHTDF